MHSVNLDDLRTFSEVARRGSLRQAAEALHASPSAVSKALRRLEADLQAPLFDRRAGVLRLNADGQRLQRRAQALLSLAQDTLAEFRGDRHASPLRVSGPALLLARTAPALVAALDAQPGARGLAAADAYEDAALAALERAEVDVALVTAVAITPAPPAGIEALPLGRLPLCLAVHHRHPLAAGAHAACVQRRLQDLQDVDFVAPLRSPFCGIARGPRADGWREDLAPRQIRHWADDLPTRLALVLAGQAVAYLPEDMVHALGLVRIALADHPHDCVEALYLAWQPATAPGWLHALVDAVRQAHADAARPDQGRPDQG